MDKNNLTNNLQQDIKLSNYSNMYPIVKFFFLIKLPKYYLFTKLPINHLNKYIENYKNELYKSYKYPIMINYKNNKINNTLSHKLDISLLSIKNSHSLYTPENCH